MEKMKKANPLLLMNINIGSGSGKKIIYLQLNIR